MLVTQRKEGCIIYGILGDFAYGCVIGRERSRGKLKCLGPINLLHSRLYDSVLKYADTIEFF